MSKMIRLLVPVVAIALAAAAWGPLDSNYAGFTQLRSGGGRGSRRQPPQPPPQTQPATPTDTTPAAPTPPPAPSSPSTSTSGASLGGSDPSNTPYPFVVTLNDGREIKCDVQEDGDNYNLIKKAGTIVVGKTDVKSIQSTGNGPATQPATVPSAN